MPYHGNTGQQAEQDDANDDEEEDKMPMFNVYYDSPSGSGKEKVRAVNGKEAEKIMMDRGPNTVVNDVNMVSV